MAQNIRDYLTTLMSKEVIDKICRRGSVPMEEYTLLMPIYIAEAVHGYDLIKPFLDNDKKILEIGGGIMLLHSYLRKKGCNVVSIEPIGSGFDFFRIRDSVLDSLECRNVNLLNIKAEELSPEKYGKFDLIYSINVLEHIEDLGTAMSKMTGVLSDSGTMVHTCPNYMIPYEPHFSLPLVPIWPSVSKHIFKRKISRNEGLWESLNFITHRTVDKLSRENNLLVEYEKGVFGSTLNRIGSDEEFAMRHNSIIRFSINAIKFVRLDVLLDKIPGKYLTPITFTMSKG